MIFRIISLTEQNHKLRYRPQYKRFLFWHSVGDSSGYLTAEEALKEIKLFKKARKEAEIL